MSLVSVRRTLHRLAELSGREVKTAAFIQGYLKEHLSLPSRRFGPNDTGVVCDIGAEPPSVLLRGDTDALPIAECNQLQFKSEDPSVSHMCGHDGHSAMLVGAAHRLVDAGVSGVRLLFQPAEETSQGALWAIDAGLLQGIKYAFGGHIDPRYSVGEIIIEAGGQAVNASVDDFVFAMESTGGHAARPHLADRDLALSAADLLQQVHRIVPRRLNPAHLAVVTVGRIDVGSAGNVLASRGEVHGTARSFDAETRSLILAELAHIASRFEAKFRVKEGPPPNVNEACAVELALKGAEKAAMRVVPLTEPNFGGEDFAHFASHTKSCYVRYGAATNTNSGAAHSPTFDFCEEVLDLGAAYLSNTAALAKTEV